jgi:hypothetical protein
MISVRVAAEMIGTYQKHITRLIAWGKLPGAYRIGEARNSPYIIPLESVTAYIAQQKAQKKTRRGQAQ